MVHKAMRWCLLSLFFLTSCAGYRFTQTDNPLSQYGVESLSVPMFYNFSSLPEVSPAMTRETYKILSGFSALKLKSGYQNADAILIGIIRSPESLKLTTRPSSLRDAKNVAPNNVGARRAEFYIPGATEVDLRLQVLVIKHPSEEELRLLQSELGPKIPAQGKILFNETFPLTGSFTREFYDDEPGTVVATQNAGALRRAQDTMALQAAEQIRDMILYAF
jgi:hypothetical protein